MILRDSPLLRAGLLASPKTSLLAAPRASRLAASRPCWPAGPTKGPFGTARTYASAFLSPVEQYDEDCAQGLITNDEHQRKQLDSLNSVHAELMAYQRDRSIAKAAAAGKPVRSIFSRMFGGPSVPVQYGPRGIYLYGDVGSGKTMLMDMFYKTVPPHLTKKRLHFHAFMRDMHKEIHSIKTTKASKEDAIELATHRVSARVDLLCLDEVAVIDVADAMILRHIWETMYADGVVTFMTSNREPDELYKNGVQRRSFLPAIGLIKERNHVKFLDSPTDYRKLPRPASGTYYFVSEKGHDPEHAREHADHWFAYFGAGEPEEHRRQLTIWGRNVNIPRSAGNNVMQLTFMELCAENRSANDYLEMCQTFGAAVITDIPPISLEQRDLIRRFITFLDAAYDSHLKLAVTAATSFDRLFNTKHLRINPETNKVELQGAEDAAEVDLSNFAGHEEMFAFARALSRLKQMSSAQWLNFERV